MKYLGILILSCFTSFVGATSTQEAMVSEGFEKLRSLEGDWAGTLPDGNPIEISYQIINGGAVLERYRSKDPMWWNMSTVYHLNNSAIVMSHYCSWGNHPRMKASSITVSTKQLDFDFIDLAENIPSNGHMRDLAIKFVDDNNLIHNWVWREKEKDTPLTLTLARKK